MGDDYQRTFPDRWPDFPVQPYVPYTPPEPDVSRKEFDDLRKEVKELVKLLKAGKAYDEATGQADCEMEEKVEFIKRLADYLDVDLEDLFG